MEVYIKLQDLKDWRAKRIQNGECSYDDMTALNAFIDKVEKVTSLSEWHSGEEPPDSDRKVIAYSTRGEPYIAKYKEGYYWYRPQVRQSDMVPVRWKDIE